MLELKTIRGRPQPIGAVMTSDGINFAVFSRHATAVTLVVLPESGSTPLAEVPFDPNRNRTGDIWHLRLQGLPETFRYAYRVDGPQGPTHRFDPTRLLIDPASLLLSNGAEWAGTCQTDPHRTSRLSLFHRRQAYDWGDDGPPRTPLEDGIIYEVHVRGFTAHPSSGVAAPGTFRGLVEKIPYLTRLGITAVELLPVHEFDECDCPFTDPTTGEKLLNFWGYNTVAFAAPKAAYAASAKDYGQLHEFRDCVKAFHKAGIEVYLDVVFNHTGEGGDDGRAYSFRGLDNEVYYLLDEEGRYLNFSGTGNTVNCNHPVVRDLLMTCLRYWVGDMHVDGFRFDLASILGRNRLGGVAVEPPVIEAIADDGVLADAKLIAEPWDAAGLYQVGRFPFGRRWSEWNGPFRDDVRRFWKGQPGLTGALATRLCGSADLYQSSGRLPRHSVNFVTCHDGFTLLDLVSYNEKHNERNGEGNRDGNNANDSWNCGAEGPTVDPEILALRQRQVRNLFATLMLSQGVPMLLAGDEFLRTQQGNNNAWCQDNEIGWVDWKQAEENADFLRFAREMIGLRRRHPALRRRRFLTGNFRAAGESKAAGPFPPGGPVRPAEAGMPAGQRKGRAIARTNPLLATAPALADIFWHGTEPFRPDFGQDSRVLAYSLDGRFTGREDDPDYAPDCDFYVAFSAAPHPVTFVVPPSPTGREWRRVVHTAELPPRDIVAEGKGPAVEPGTALTVPAFATVVLVSDP
ncbi:MAG TPA: glycogen debranching protein GlgX [Fimbriiglobus sp.]|jgi:glycogen operon protein